MEEVQKENESLRERLAMLENDLKTKIQILEAERAELMETVDDLEHRMAQVCCETEELQVRLACSHKEISQLKEELEKEKLRKK